ncbi:hypothetical protein MRX96_007384 [Rhipicephalus microplus]
MPYTFPSRQRLRRHSERLAVQGASSLSFFHGQRDRLTKAVAASRDADAAPCLAKGARGFTRSVGKKKKKKEAALRFILLRLVSPSHLRRRRRCPLAPGRARLCVAAREDNRGLASSTRRPTTTTVPDKLPTSAAGVSLARELLFFERITRFAVSCNVCTFAPETG